MGPLVHIGAALAYGTLAAAIAVRLAGHAGAGGPLQGVLAGGLLLLVAGLVHACLVRAGRDDAHAFAVQGLQAEVSALRGELVRARGEAQAIREALAPPRSRPGRMRPAPDDPAPAPVPDATAVPGPRHPDLPVLQDLPGRPDLPGLQDLPGPWEGPPAGGDVVALVREALRGDRIEVAVQPIVSLPQRRHRHYQCFAWIRSAGGGALTPDAYRAQAEQGGLVTSIDNMVLFRAAHLARRVATRRPDARFFVTLSPRTLADPFFLEDFLAFFQDNEALSRQLVFELAQADLVQAESAPAEPGRAQPAGAAPTGADGAVREAVEVLAGLGFAFALGAVTEPVADPAGLAALGVRFVRIPAALLQNPPAGWDPAAAVAGLAEAGIALIVEGIEEEQALVELLDLPVELGQGPLFGEPRPAREERAAA